MEMASELGKLRAELAASKEREAKLRDALERAADVIRDRYELSFTEMQYEERKARRALESSNE